MFSKSSKYAIRSVLYIAVNAGADKKISPKSIAEALQVPAAYLAKILQVLTGKNLVSATRGRHGGFFLNAAQRMQTLIAVIDAIDGLGALEECTLGLAECSDANPCPFHETTTSYREKLVLKLSSQTIADVCLEIEKGEVRIMEL